MKVIAYILFGLQLFSLFGTIVGGEFTKLLMNMTFFNGVPGFCEFLGYLVPTWLGIFFLNLASKQKAKKNVMFFCPICQGVHEGPPGEAQGCPTCHRPTVQTEVLRKDWERMTPDNQNAWKAYWMQRS